jgi:ABC-2 type transport system permease protein
MSKIGIIIGREYSTRVKKKSFIIGTLLVPLLMAAIMVTPILIAFYSTDNKVREIALADQSGIVAEKLQNSETINYHTINAEEAESLKKDIASSPYYALVQISQLDSTNNAVIAIYSDEQISLPLRESIEHHINSILTEHKLRSYNIVDLDKVIANINNSSHAKTFQTTESGEQKESNIGIHMGVSYLSSFIIYFFILMFGGMVMQGVIEEKSNRIIEVIVSSVKPIEIMFGKIIGIALVALTQFVAWIALTFLIVTGVSMVAASKGNDKLMQQAAQAQANVSTIPGMEQNVPNISDVLSQDQTEDSNMEKLSSFMGAIGGLNILGIIVTFALFFILGYLLYASLCSR